MDNAEGHCPYCNKTNLVYEEVTYEEDCEGLSSPELQVKLSEETKECSRFFECADCGVIGFEEYKFKPKFEVSIITRNRKKEVKLCCGGTYNEKPYGFVRCNSPVSVEGHHFCEEHNTEEIKEEG